MKLGFACLITFAGMGAAHYLAAQESSSPAPTNAPGTATLSTAKESYDAISPVAYFRTLLAMSPQQRVICLTNRPPDTRKRILQKVQEYERLSPDERELRLRATELRWYIMPLLAAPAGNHDRALAGIPADLREIVRTRLTEWDILPQPLKEEFLENEKALYYFAGVRRPDNGAEDVALAAQRARISSQFNQFLELTPDEKKQTLDSLSTEERFQMQKTLEAFGKLTSVQKYQCIQNYARFAGMSDMDRAEFLKNAERWSQMSAVERQAWRDLVANVPDWPPLPASIFPPGSLPTTEPSQLTPGTSSVATN